MHKYIVVSLFVCLAPQSVYSTSSASCTTEQISRLETNQIPDASKVITTELNSNKAARIVLALMACDLSLDYYVAHKSTTHRSKRQAPPYEGAYKCAEEFIEIVVEFYRLSIADHFPGTMASLHALFDDRFLLDAPNFPENQIEELDAFAELIKKTVKWYSSPTDGLERITQAILSERTVYQYGQYLQSIGIVTQDGYPITAFTFYREDYQRFNGFIFTILPRLHQERVDAIYRIEFQRIDSSFDPESPMAIWVEQAVSTLREWDQRLSTQNQELEGGHAQPADRLLPRQTYLSFLVQASNSLSTIFTRPHHRHVDGFRSLLATLYFRDEPLAISAGIFRPNGSFDVVFTALDYTATYGEPGYWSHPAAVRVIENRIIGEAFRIGAPVARLFDPGPTWRSYRTANELELRSMEIEHERQLRRQARDTAIQRNRVNTNSSGFFAQNLYCIRDQ